MLQHFVTLEGGKVSTDEEAYRKLKQLFAPFVLRRKKDDVLNQVLPPKTERLEQVELNADARTVYDSIIAEHLQAKERKDDTFRDHLFTQLRKAAHHPLMIRSRHKSPLEKVKLTKLFYDYGAFRGDGVTKDKVSEELERYSDFEIHLTALMMVDENRHRRPSLDPYILSEQDLFSSAKCARLQKLLPELVSGGHRILIFSVWTTCLDLLGCLLEQMGLKHLRMDGQSPVSERQSLIDQFNRDDSIPVFLLSTKACGLGITLTAADVCIMHDLDFNPFTDLQAEARCHRIGQRKPVTVIKMVTKDTVDEQIYAMQQRKAKMNQAIMENSSQWKKQAEKDKKEVLDAAVSQFLARSPPRKATLGKENEEKLKLESS
jgi:SWI/SNF-related matrix-associated actin-dependent regulator 1 of chromatin subfamily A